MFCYAGDDGAVIYAGVYGELEQFVCFFDFLSGQDGSHAEVHFGEVVEGDGVIGQFPRLEPGAEFPYNSCHTVSQDSRAEGAYFAQTDDGQIYIVPIPPFDLNLPQWV